MVRPVFPEYLVILPSKEAIKFARTNCPFCIELVTFLKKHPKWNGWVNTRTRDLVAVSK